MNRERMRNPVRILSRFMAVCCGDVPPDVFLLAVPDFRAFLPDRDGLFLLVSLRISSRWGCVIGPPYRARVASSGSCRSPRIGFGQRRIRLPLLGVRLKDDEKNLPQGAALVRVPTGRFLFRLPFASPAGTRRHCGSAPRSCIRLYGVQRPVC